LRAAVAERPFALEQDAPLAKTVSIGFAVFPFVRSDPQAVTWTQVVELLADQALYMAKHAGRNTWFGLAASDKTDAATLLRQLGTSAEEAAQAGLLDVIRQP
jgi:predicted signal transduction protein with EAL and GGDEF domain